MGHKYRLPRQKAWTSVGKVGLVAEDSDFAPHLTIVVAKMGRERMFSFFLQTLLDGICDLAHSSLFVAKRLSYIRLVSIRTFQGGIHEQNDEMAGCDRYVFWPFRL